MFSVNPTCSKIGDIKIIEMVFHYIRTFFQSDLLLWHCVISLQMATIFPINPLNANHDCKRGKKLWYASWFWSKIRLDISCELSTGPEQTIPVEYQVLLCWLK